MSPIQTKTLFALDPGATNWRLYRAVYELENGRARLLSEPASSPLTSFSERSLPAAFILNDEGDGLSSYGEAALAQLENPEFHTRLRAHFKSSFAPNPEGDTTPNLYTREQALEYTRLLLKAVLDGIRLEKWRGLAFDDDVILSFAHPVHWAQDNEGAVLEEFKMLVEGCKGAADKASLRFVSESEAAIYSLQHLSLLPDNQGEQVTLIVDIGGSTTDLVASDLESGDPVFLSRYGGPLGGEDFDLAVVAHLADVLNITPENLQEDPALALNLSTIARRMKEALSRGLLQGAGNEIAPSRAITIVNAQGRIFRGSVELDEERFIELTQHQTDSFKALFVEALNDMGLAESEIGRVVLVGGGSQLFSLVRWLRERFGADRVLLADNPSETVVHGVSLEYGAALAQRRPTLIFKSALLEPEEPEPEPVFAPEAQPQQAWQLVSDSGEIIPLRLGPNPIGRASSNAVTIKSNTVSRWHAEIHLDVGGGTVMDLGSTNGTYLDGVRLAAKQHTPISEGAKLRFGDLAYRLLFVIA
jgi:molecular chaperone DnaK